MRLPYFLIFILTAIVCASAPAQDIEKDSLLLLNNSQDTLFVEAKSDTIDIKKSNFVFNPRKAGLYSAVLPGLGQAYNKRYWKIPLVYGGLIGFGYAMTWYNDQYLKYKNELFYILDNDLTRSPSGLSEDQLRSIIDQARRERDYMIVLTGIVYLLNIADAHIDAHLKEFDVNEDLKLKLDPTVLLIGNTIVPGLSIKIKL